MSIIPPGPVQIPGDLLTYRPVGNVTPFTYRSGITYQALLETLRVYIVDVLTPNIYDEMGELTESWSDNLETLRTAVNTALSAQTADNAAKISDALAAIANADIPITDPAIRAVLNSAQTATRQWLDGHYASSATLAQAITDMQNAIITAFNSFKADYARLLAQQVIIAPAPKGSGQDDTAAIMAAIAPLHAAGATFILQRGTYLVNLDLPAQFAQVKIVGQGMWATTLKAFSKTYPAVKFNGGSGQFGGGGLFECGIDSAAGANREGIALAFCGSTGTKAQNVRIFGSFSEAVRFWNQRPNDFTEYCTFEGDIGNCTTPVVYAVDNGVESFHGSGLVGQTTINVPGDKTGPIIATIGNALPYNAPLFCTVWFQSAAQYLMYYANPNGNRAASFYGSIKMEGHPSGSDVELVQSAGAEVLFEGGLIGLGVGDMMLGKLFQCTKIAYEGGTVIGSKLKYSTRTTLKGNSPTIIAFNFDSSSIYLVAVTIVGPNYHKTILLAVWQSPYDSSGTVTEIVRPKNFDNANVGEPQFTMSQGALFCANSAFTPSFYVHATVQNAGGEYTQLLAQRKYT